MGSWFKTGEEASQYVNEESERSELAADSKFIRRWYMKKTPDDEDGKTITFVDDSKHPAGYPLPFVFWEHQIELNGRWTNWFTCALEGAEIQLRRRMKRIEDIALGDEVLTHEGRYRPVKATMERMYQGDAVCLRLPKVGNLEMTGNHRIWATPQPSSGSGKTGRHRKALDAENPVLIPIRDLRTGDYVWVPKTPGDSESKVSLNLAWFLGLYAADGSSSWVDGRYIGSEVTLAKHEAFCIPQIRQALTKFGVACRITEHSNCVRVKWRHESLGEKLKGWCGGFSGVKRLPDFIVNGSDEVVRAAVDGLMLGDGYEDSYHATYTTISKTLANQVFSMWLRLGFAPALRFVDKCKDEVRHDVYLVQRPVKGRQYGSHVTGDGMWLRIREASSRQIQQPVFNMTVDGDNSYTVGSVAVANCLQGIEDAEGKEMQCPICASGRKPSLCAAYTIRNENPYETKSGMKNLDGTELNLFVCKTKTQKIIQKSMRKRGSLRGWRVEVTRNGSGTDSANVGDVFEWEKQIELPDDVQPFPYHELFAPKTEQELKAILSGVAPASSQPKTSTPPIPAEDDVVRF